MVGKDVDEDGVDVGWEFWLQGRRPSCQGQRSNCGDTDAQPMRTCGSCVEHDVTANRINGANDDTCGGDVGKRVKAVDRARRVSSTRGLSCHPKCERN